MNRSIDRERLMMGSRGSLVTASRLCRGYMR